MGEIRKIIWFNTILNTSGGGERVMVETLRCLEQKGIESCGLVYCYDEESVFDGKYKLNIIPLLDERTVLKRNLSSKIKRQLSILLQLRKKISDISPDIIISPGTWSQAIDVFLATLFTSFHYTVFIYGSIFAFPPTRDLTKYAMVFKKYFDEIRLSQDSYKEIVPKKIPRCSLRKKINIELLALLKYLSIRNAKRIFVLSHRNKWEVEKLYGRPAMVFKGAFPDQIFNYNPKRDIRQKLGLKDKKIVMNINRLIGNKKVDLCIRSFKNLSEKFNDIALIIGGEGPEENNLKNLVNELNINSKVKFVGYIKEEELWDYYASCDVFVHMDRAEFDIAPLEALALGKKVVWSIEMEIDDFMENFKNKFIFPTRPTAYDTAEAIERALAKNTTTADMSILKKELFRYTWENFSGKILEELKKVKYHERVI